MLSAVSGGWQSVPMQLSASSPTAASAAGAAETAAEAAEAAAAGGSRLRAEVVEATVVVAVTASASVSFPIVEFCKQQIVAAAGSKSDTPTKLVR